MGTRFLAIAFVSTALLAGVPAIGQADSKPGIKQRVAHARGRGLGHNKPQRAEHHWRKWHRVKGQATSVPELDSGAAGQGLSLLLAATALLIDRRRRPV